MSDSNALRSRRKRAHAAGDHSLCRRCDALSAPPAVPVADGAGVNPQSMLEALAKRLEAASEADPADAAVARELRATLLVLQPLQRVEEDDDPLAELRALDPSVP